MAEELARVREDCERTRGALGEAQQEVRALYTRLEESSADHESQVRVEEMM